MNWMALDPPRLVNPLAWTLKDPNLMREHRAECGAIEVPGSLGPRCTELATPHRAHTARVPDGPEIGTIITQWMNKDRS